MQGLIDCRWERTEEPALAVLLSAADAPSVRNAFSVKSCTTTHGFQSQPGPRC